VAGISVMLRRRFGAWSILILSMLYDLKMGGGLEIYFAGVQGVAICIFSHSGFLEAT